MTNIWRIGIVPTSFGEDIKEVPIREVKIGEEFRFIVRYGTLPWLTLHDIKCFKNGKVTLKISLYSMSKIRRFKCNGSEIVNVMRNI